MPALMDALLWVVVAAMALLAVLACYGMWISRRRRNP
jgi:uncharacterized protein YneF (UPF0154 family)